MSVETIARPLPALYEWNRPFFAGGREGRLLLQRCRACRQLIYYPRIVCPYCLWNEYDWVPLSGRGTVYSFSVVWRPKHPAFDAEVPIVLAAIDLEEGVQIVSSLRGVNHDDAAIDMAVRVVFEQLSDDVFLPRFEAR